jgi:hypothetical protein
VVAVIGRNAVLALTTLALSTLPLPFGVLGRTYNRSQLEAALVNVNPKDQAVIREFGYREAARPFQLGGVLTLITLPSGLVAFALRKRKP